MTLETLVKAAAGLQASDLHLEGGLAPCVRVRGQLRSTGEPLRPTELTALARELLGDEAWPAFLERRSADVARTIGGQRCRINVLCSSRGVGLALRFLSAAQVSLERLNLHPDLARLVLPHHGLVVVSGPTGSGKTSTLAALLQELNRREARHVVTLESPIEYPLAPQRCFIRQREVGRDTPSFAQGLYDALREDPDVLVVGELRDPETIQLTLNAAETGHLVLTTMHSSTTAEALQRVVGAFPSEVQSAVAAQLADCLVGVVSQRLRHLPGPSIRVPESQNARAMIRQGQFFKLQSALETGAADGSWTSTRYREWMERRTEWFVEPGEPPLAEAMPADGAGIPQAPASREASATRARKRPGTLSVPPSDGVLEINAADDDLDQIVRDLDR
jgi:twitching motility protein PilT